MPDTLHSGICCLFTTVTDPVRSLPSSPDASSGYLSAVDLTDTEDMGVTVAIVGQDSQASPQMAVMGGSYPGLSPMIIMNNIVLKQVRHTTVVPLGLLFVPLDSFRHSL